MVNRIVSVDETFTLPATVRDKLNTDLGASSPGEVLGVTVHNPATQAQFSNVNGANFAAIAPAVLLVTFTAPASGTVTVTMEAHVQQCGEAGFWALQSAGALVPGTATRVSGPVALDQGGRVSATVLVEDLNPGQSYTFAWATAHSGSGTFSLRAGGSASTAGSVLSGAATMIVRDAPF